MLEPRRVRDEVALAGVADHRPLGGAHRPEPKCEEDGQPERDHGNRGRREGDGAFSGGE